VIRLSALLRQPAVSLADAEQVGAVDAIAVRRGRIVAVGVGKLVVPASAVRTFEGDTLTFDPFSSTAVESERPITGVVGHLVLSRKGDDLGRLVDLDIEADGTIALVELPDRTWPGDRLAVIGSYAAIVDDDPDGPAPSAAGPPDATGRSAGTPLPPPTPSATAPTRAPR